MSWSLPLDWLVPPPIMTCRWYGGNISSLAGRIIKCIWMKWKCFLWSLKLERIYRSSQPAPLLHIFKPIVWRWWFRQVALSTPAIWWRPGVVPVKGTSGGGGPRTPFRGDWQWIFLFFFWLVWGHLWKKKKKSF